MQLAIDNSNYDSFLNTRFISGNFLQSSLWRRFLEAQGKGYWQLAVSESGRVIATCLFYQNPLPLSRSYLYAPKGPIFSATATVEQKTEALRLILSKARDVMASTRRSEEIFFKLDLAEEVVLPPGLVKSDDVQPRVTRCLDLTKEPSELLVQMHPKTRYNISLAKRKGLSIRFSQSIEDARHFLDLIKKTAAHNQISVHRDDYYRALLQTLFKNKSGYLALACLGERVLAANIMLVFGSAATYLHGASDYKYHNYMAPHLLQWESIKKAQDEGCLVYDFWGVAPNDSSKPNWAGLTRFKKGFGGQSQSAPGGHSLIYDQGWYNIYHWLKKIRRWSGL